MQMRYKIGLDFLPLVAMASGHVVCAGGRHLGGSARGSRRISFILFRQGNNSIETCRLKLPCSVIECCGCGNTASWST